MNVICPMHAAFKSQCTLYAENRDVQQYDAEETGTVPEGGGQAGGSLAAHRALDVAQALADRVQRLQRHQLQPETRTGDLDTYCTLCDRLSPTPTHLSLVSTT